MTRRAIDTIVTYCRTHPEILLVYLYGSQARDEAKKESDIDLAILVDEKLADPFQTRLLVMGELPALLGRDVDIQDLDSCSVTFSYRVISEGQVLFCPNEQIRISFEEKVMRNFFDLCPFLTEYGKMIAHLAREGKIDARPFSY